MSDSSQIRFWEKPLDQLNSTEWEALCDGCGRCCLKKLQDTETEMVAYTRVVCRYLDTRDSRCGCYSERHVKVPDCLIVSTMDLRHIHWMPDTCAYRLRAEDKPLYNWHPLIAGSRQAMQELGISVRGKVISEEYVHEDGLGEHIIHWVKAG